MKVWDDIEGELREPDFQPHPGIACTRCGGYGVELVEELLSRNGRW